MTDEVPEGGNAIILRGIARREPLASEWQSALSRHLQGLRAMRPGDKTVRPADVDCAGF